MGPNNLPAPSSFPYVEVVARACQHQVAQLSSADGAVLWHTSRDINLILMTQEQWGLWGFKIQWVLGLFFSIHLLR